MAQPSDGSRAARPSFLNAIIPLVVRMGGVVTLFGLAAINGPVQV